MSRFLKTLSCQLRQPFDSLYAYLRLKKYHPKQRSLEEVVGWVINFGGGAYLTVNTLQIPTEITKRAKAMQAVQKSSSNSVPLAGCVADLVLSGIRGYTPRSTRGGPII